MGMICGWLKLAVYMNRNNLMRTGLSGAKTIAEPVFLMGACLQLAINVCTESGYIHIASHQH